MLENYEIKFELPEHTLGDFRVQKATAKVYQQYADILGEEETQEIFARTWADLDEVERLESLGRYEEAEEIEDALDEYLESIMDMIEALQDSDYGESWS